MSQKTLISIVDDDDSVREAIKGLLESWEFAVEAFPSALEFLASPYLQETACLIADVQMPHMTGVELHRRLLDSGNAIPTILITAYANEGVRDRALRSGVMCFLSKPFDENVLLTSVRSALAST